MTIKKGYVETPDGQIHYRFCDGGAGLPLVFLHQTASSSQTYEKLMGVLQEQYRMIALDTPGFGQSDFPPQAPTISSYVATLLTALQNLGVHEFHAFGHHTGACIACEMAVTAPARVRGLMMVGPAYLDEADRNAGHENSSILWSFNLMAAIWQRFGSEYRVLIPIRLLPSATEKP